MEGIKYVDIICKRSITEREGKTIVTTVSEQPLVRCKICEKRKNNICHNPNTFGAIVNDEYFCADGRAKR